MRRFLLCIVMLSGTIGLYLSWKRKVLQCYRIETPARLSEGLGRCSSNLVRYHRYVNPSVLSLHLLLSKAEPAELNGLDSADQRYIAQRVTAHVPWLQAFGARYCSLVFLSLIPDFQPDIQCRCYHFVPFMRLIMEEYNSTFTHRT